MKKFLTVLLSLVLILDVAPVFAYAAGSSDLAEEVKAAEEKLAEANEKLEQAQNAYNDYIQNDPQIEEKYLEAQKAVTEAEDALRQAELELASAQAAYDSAESIFQEKVSAQEQAQIEYDRALQTKNEKAAAKEETEAILAAALEAYDAVCATIGDDLDVAAASAAFQAAKDDVAAARKKVQEKIWRTINRLDH